MTKTLGQSVRENIMGFIATLPNVPSQTPGEARTVRDDGVVEFNRYWRVRGTPTEGLFASLVDRDDMIEFGLLARTRDGEPLNVLHCTVLLDADEAPVNCMSELNAAFNFDEVMKADKLEPLNRALEFFGEGLRTA